MCNHCTEYRDRGKYKIHVVHGEGEHISTSYSNNQYIQDMNIKINNVQLKRRDGGGGCISTSHSESVSYHRRSIGGFLHGLNTLSSQLSFF